MSERSRCSSLRGSAAPDSVGLSLRPGQAAKRPVQRAGSHVPPPLGLPEDPQVLTRFRLELIQLPLQILDPPLQGLVLIV